jgi:hypothetical protein
VTIGAVERQARHLDRIRPGWAREIDVVNLDMLDNHYCILGQLYGSALRAPHGTFSLHPGAYFMSPLCRKRWLRQIRARVEAMQPGKQEKPERYEPLEHPVPAKREPAPAEPAVAPLAPVPEREKVGV